MRKENKLASLLTIAYFTASGASESIAQAANNADAAKFQMIVCIANSVDKLDDGITQANAIGGVILRQPCYQHLKPIVDHTDFKQFGITRSRAHEMISEQWTDQATIVVLERRSKLIRQKEEACATSKSGDSK